MIKAVKLVSIPVRDQDRAVRFYTEKLGFQIFTDQPFDDKQRWIELRIPGSETKVVLFTPPEHEDRVGSFSNVTFLTDDIDRTYQELKDRGVEFTAAPTKHHGVNLRRSVMRMAISSSFPPNEPGRGWP